MSHKALATSLMKSRSIRPLSLVDYFCAGGGVYSPIGCLALFFSLLCSGLYISYRLVYLSNELGVDGLFGGYSGDLEWICSLSPSVAGCYCP